MAHTKTIRQAKNIWICYALDTKKYNYNNYGVLRMVRKVKLILGWTMFLDLGKLCNRFLCVASFIISKLPCSSTSEIICLVCLCLNKIFVLLQSSVKRWYYPFPKIFHHHYAIPFLRSHYDINS